MKRLTLALILVLAATAAGAASPYFLDRTGLLWKAEAAPEGLVLSGTREGKVVVRSVVPFAIGLAGSSDTEIQVAADELTGKVTVVWQRNWTSTITEIMLAVWRGGEWERIEHLTPDLTMNPRFPAIEMLQVATETPSADPSQSVVVRDSFVQVVWWEGVGQSQHGEYAALRLTDDSADRGNIIRVGLDSFITVGLACDAPIPPSVLERPLFASKAGKDFSMVFVGSQRICLFQLIEARPTLEPQPQGSPGIRVGIQRRRHTIVFGVRRLFPVPEQVSLEGARMIVGSDLHPVAYRVNGKTIEYVVANETGWSPLRTLPVGAELSLDQAIPLVENLAR